MGTLSPSSLCPIFSVPQGGLRPQCLPQPSSSHSSSYKYHHTVSAPQVRLVAAGLSQQAQHHMETDLTVHHPSPQTHPLRAFLCQESTTLAVLGAAASEPVGVGWSDWNSCWVRAWLQDTNQGLCLNYFPTAGKTEKEPPSPADLAECAEQGEPGKPRWGQKPWSLFFRRFKP